MTQQEFANKIIHHLKRFKIKCPACQEKKIAFKVIAAFTRIPILANAFQEHPNGVAPLVTCSCAKCGYMLSFDPSVIPGLIEEPREESLIVAPDVPGELLKNIERANEIIG